MVTVLVLLSLAPLRSRAAPEATVTPLVLPSEAEVGDEVAKEWVTLTARSRRDEVTFNNDDFPDAMRRRK